MNHFLYAAGVHMRVLAQQEVIYFSLYVSDLQSFLQTLEGERILLRLAVSAVISLNCPVVRIFDALQYD